MKKLSPLINILIRTSDGRRELFQRCLASVRDQTYKNIQAIICADSDGSYYDANNTRMGMCSVNTQLHRVTPEGDYCYWNLYCNYLKAQVKEGWFFYLDSDDFLADPGAVKRLVGHLPANDNGVICRFLRRGSPKPTSFYFNRRIIRVGNIGGSCIILQAKHKDLAMWQAKKAADYSFICDMEKKIKFTWVKTNLVHADNSGLKGRNPKAVKV